MDYIPSWNRVSICGGYKAVYCPDHPNCWSTGYIHVHRIVAEQKIGRLLKKGEQVHHIDENKLNNDPTNIEVLPGRGEHTKIHARNTRKMKEVKIECPECGKIFLILPCQDGRRFGNKNKFCSRRCNGRHGRKIQIENGMSNLRR